MLRTGQKKKAPGEGSRKRFPDASHNTRPEDRALYGALPRGPGQEREGDMSEPEEQYTLPRVLEIVRGHAKALEKGADALHGVDGNDLEVLGMLGERLSAR